MQKNNVEKFQTKEQIQDQACLWVSRMDRGISDLERQRLVSWCNQHATHYKTLLEVASYWDDASILSELSGLFPLESITKTKKQSNSLVLAASIILCALLGTNTFIKESFLPFFPSFNEYALSQKHTIVSPLGEQTSFIADDGSHIQLNTNSIVEVDFSSSYRKITLVKGEARFDVAKDKSRPFIVTSDEKSFTALGTIFNVQKHNQEMELLVTEGTVLVTKANEGLQVIQNAILKANEQGIKQNLPGFVVTSGNKVSIKNNVAKKIQEVTLDQMNRELAWQQGMLIFDGESLSSAINEINRYSEIKLTIADPTIANIKVSGYFETNDTQSLLDSLKSNFNILASSLPNRNIQLKSGR